MDDPKMMCGEIYLDKQDEGVTRTSWKTISGKFSAVMGCNSACINPHSMKGVSPAAHLGDGHLDLIVVKVVVC